MPVKVTLPTVPALVPVMVQVLVVFGPTRVSVPPSPLIVTGVLDEVLTTLIVLLPVSALRVSPAIPAYVRPPKKGRVTVELVRV